jgi:hypothetical protein
MERLGTYHGDPVHPGESIRPDNAPMANPRRSCDVILEELPRLRS